MPSEHLVREFYNQMYRVHTQLDNAYDLGDHLHHLTVHKHLDQDPLIQFREAYRWVDQAGARLVADAGCGYGGFAVFVARQAPILSVDGYTLSDVQRAVARQALARLHQSKSRALLQSYDRLQRQYDAIVAIESLGHAAPFDLPRDIREFGRVAEDGAGDAEGCRSDRLRTYWPRDWRRDRRRRS